MSRIIYDTENLEFKNENVNIKIKMNNKKKFNF